MSGIAVGVVGFTFIAALMNGLSARLTEDITGNVAHVTLEPEPRSPRAFLVSPGKRSLFAIQPGHDVKPVMRTYRFVLAVAARMQGVRVDVPEVFGNGTLARGEKNVAVAVTGVEQMQDRQDCTVGHGVEKFVRMPRRGQRPGFRLAIAHDARDHQLGIVEHRPERMTQRIPELATFVDRARTLW